MVSQIEGVRVGGEERKRGRDNPYYMMQSARELFKKLFVALFL